MSEMPETSERLRQMMAGYQAMAAAMGRWVSEVMPPLIAMFETLASDPAVREAMAAAERGELVIEPYRPCHCFCGASHPDQEGICDGDAVTELTRQSPRFGRLDIPMCAPCAAAAVSVAVS